MIDILYDANNSKTISILEFLALSYWLTHFLEGLAEFFPF